MEERRRAAGKPRNGHAFISPERVLKYSTKDEVTRNKGVTVSFHMAKITDVRT